MVQTSSITCKQSKLQMIKLQMAKFNVFCISYLMSSQRDKGRWRLRSLQTGSYLQTDKDTVLNGHVGMVCKWTCPKEFFFSLVFHHLFLFFQSQTDNGKPKENEGRKEVSQNPQLNSTLAAKIHSCDNKEKGKKHIYNC